ncbi:metalloprotease [Friedmanniomyces endolithicus]|nr:metalloprotease [Friedmanniomyces endolithicus]
MAEQPLHSHVGSGGVQRLADKLEKPLLDNRSYRVVKLSNELEALLIHDPDTDKASAAMDINVGSFSDAEDLPGMAHAVEHLLFMGTEKYPGENDYNQYLTKYGGYSNAFTASTSTNYYFELSASATSNSPSTSLNASKENLPVSISKGQSPLYGGLDRFAQFFVRPLFLEDVLDRELRAVDSENKKNLQSDNWRMMQLNKSLSSKKHPFHKFSTGNYKVLHDDPIERGVKIREAFMGFYNKHYSANRMKLVVLGRESLDTLQDWTKELFSDVPNQDLEKLRWDGMPVYGMDEVGTQIFTKPVMDRRTLDMYFTYPDEEDQWESQPSRYLSHLLGHEGPGSILAYLKAKGWCNGFSAGGSPVCPGSAFFMVQAQLTAEGLKHYKEIIKIIFNYVAMLKQEPPHKWIFEEMSKLQEVDFKYQEKIPASRTTSTLSGTMQKPLPREKLLSGQSLIRKFNPEGIQRGLSHLDPDNFRIVLISQELPVETDQKEQWYGTDYKYEKIPEDFMKELKKAAKASASERPSELHLPGKNEFVPQRLDVEKKEVAEPSLAPALIRNTDGVRVWFKKDDQFWVPRATIHVSLRTPLHNASPLNAMTAQLYKELVEDSLIEYSYDAELAGLEYSIAPTTDGLDVVVSGYNDKMPVLLEKVLITMRDLEVKQERFDVIKERVGRGFRNLEYTEPFRQIGTYSRWIVKEKGWLPEQMLEDLEGLTSQDIRVFYPQMLKQMHIELLVHGNMYKEDALRTADLVYNTLKPIRLPPNQWPTRRMLVPQPGDFAYQKTLKNPDNVNHCIEYHMTVGANIDRATRAKLLLFAQMTSEPCFDQLRTKEQLGYVVFSGTAFQGTLASYRVLIQSERDCGVLEGRIEAWLAGYEQVLREMPGDEFESYKTGLINKRLEKLKNLGQETGRFWHHVTNEVFDFELVHRDVEHIEPLTKDDMLEFYRTFFDPKSATRSKVAIHMIAQASAEAIAEKTDPAEQRKKLAEALTGVLGQLSLQADVSALSQRLEKVDIAGGDTAGIVSIVGTYLKEDPSNKPEQVDGAMEQAPAVLAQILPQLGIKAKKGEGEVEGGKAPEKRNKTVFIEDVKAWKASLPLSAGPKAARELSEFEESESKL